MSRSALLSLLSPFLECLLEHFLDLDFPSLSFDSINFYNTALPQFPHYPYQLPQILAFKKKTNFLPSRDGLLLYIERSDCLLQSSRSEALFGTHASLRDLQEMVESSAKALPHPLGALWYCDPD